MEDFDFCAYSNVSDRVDFIDPSAYDVHLPTSTISY